MKTAFNFLFFCCKDREENEDKSEKPLNKSAYSQPGVGLELKHEEVSNKKSDGEGDITIIKPYNLSEGNLRPTIVLCMDGSEHQVVLYEDKGNRRRKKGKKKRVKKQNSRPECK